GVEGLRGSFLQGVEFGVPSAGQAQSQIASSLNQDAAIWQDAAIAGDGNGQALAARLTLRTYACYARSAADLNKRIAPAQRAQAAEPHLARPSLESCRHIVIDDIVAKMKGPCGGDAGGIGAVVALRPQPVMDVRAIDGRARGRRSGRPGIAGKIALDSQR